MTNNTSSSHESSGVVLEAGSKVQGLKIGDRIAVPGQQRLSTTLTCMGNNVREIPEKLSLEDAATMPLAYATAIHCLEHLSCLRLGQTILITSACSDVGLAAIQLSQKMGVEVSLPFVSISTYMQLTLEDILLRKRRATSEILGYSPSTSPGKNF